MDKDYQAILEKLETSIKEIEDKGVSTKELKQSIEEFKKYSLKPSWQSKLIFVMLFIILVFSIYDLFNNGKSIKNINTGLRKATSELAIVNANAKAELIKSQIQVTSEIYIACNDKKKTIIKSAINDMSVEVANIKEEKQNKTLKTYTTLKFIYNGMQLTADELEKIFKVGKQGEAFKYDKSLNGVKLSEGDKFTFFNKYTFQLSKICRTETNILKVTDDKNGVLIKKVSN
jgi:hypothetical protein